MLARDPIAQDEVGHTEAAYAAGEMVTGVELRAQFVATPTGLMGPV